MKTAEIVSGAYDTLIHDEAQEALAESNGENMAAAHFADPGITSCPKCKEYFWWTAKVLRCTECGTEFNTEKKVYYENN